MVAAGGEAAAGEVFSEQWSVISLAKAHIHDTSPGLRRSGTCHQPLLASSPHNHRMEACQGRFQNLRIHGNSLSRTRLACPTLQPGLSWTHCSAGMEFLELGS